MNQRRAVVWMVFLPAVLAVTAWGILPDTTAIQRVYEKAQRQDVLQPADLQVIDAFLQQSIDAMLLSENREEAVQTRGAVSQFMGGSQPTQYSVRYGTTGLRLLEEALTEVKDWDDTDRKTDVLRDLLILTGEFSGPQAADLALQWADQQDAVMRYWVVSCITDRSVLKAIEEEPEENTQLRNDIMSALNPLIANERRALVLLPIVRFAAQIQNDQTNEILLTIANLRLEAYRGGDVEYPLVDSELLKAMAARMQEGASAGQKTQLTQAFAQLYSFVIQYYLATTEEAGLVHEYLASVIVDVERNVLGGLLGRSQNSLEKSLLGRDPERLKTEHDALLGTADQRGELARSLGFTYPDGGSAPEKLAPSEPVAESTEG